MNDRHEDFENIAVGVCTLRRPEGLRTLLKALSEQRFLKQAAPKVHVIVVDNDSIPSAKSLVDSFSGRLANLIYVNETRRGLVYARNAILDAVPLEVSWLASLDDDEVPPTNWLEALCKTAKAHTCDIVIGAVEPRFLSKNPPDWAIKSSIYRTGPFDEGVPTKFASTHNVFMSMSMIRENQWRFDQRFNLSGGEDEHFFHRAFSAGYKGVASANATVIEEIPESRLDLRWIWRRYWRMGTTLTHIDKDQANPAARLTIRILKSFARIGSGAVSTALSPLRGQLSAINGLTDVARGLGALAGLFGHSTVQYGQLSKSKNN